MITEIIGMSRSYKIGGGSGGESNEMEVSSSIKEDSLLRGGVGAEASKAEASMIGSSSFN